MRIMSKTLIFLTAQYPFGTSESFIENEIEYLADKFDEVYVISASPVNSRNVRPVPENVKVINIAPENSWTWRLASITDFNFWEQFNKDLKRKSKKASLPNMFRVAWGVYAKAQCIAQKLENLIRDNNLKPDNLTGYSYWMNESALALSLLQNRIPEFKFYARAHRWDVFEETHPIPYLPFRPFIGEKVKQIFCVSGVVADYLKNQFPEIPESVIRKAFLGTRALDAIPTHHGPNIPHIVSCSYVHARKRVDLIWDSLKKISKPVRWTHLGGGPDLPALMQRCEKEKDQYSHLQVEWKGEINNSDIRRYYASEFCDLFISLSTSEGLPVSMMEALSAGIPILSTHVGGVGEIVIENKTGWLLPADPDPVLVTEKLETILSQSPESFQRLRQNAYAYWEQHFRADKVYPETVALIAGQ